MTSTFSTWDAAAGLSLCFLRSACRRAVQSVSIFGLLPISQSANSERTTLRNAELEGVQDRIELHTADMRRLPFPNGIFDVVTSSLAIHNIGNADGRERALREILRVLKADGTVMIADFRHTGDYQRYFSAKPGTKVESERLDWRFWHGGPHAATTLVKVRRSRLNP